VEYPKTENLYPSNEAQDSTKRRGPEFGFKAPGVDQIGRWLVTEKVDGMNMRIIWEPDSDLDPRIYGRTDRAQIPGDLLAVMRDTFTYETMMSAFSSYTELEDGTVGHVRPESVILFGEGFGPGIQKAGAAYGGEKRFVLFDVVVDGHWLSWDNVEDVARKLGAPTVPVLARGVTLEQAKSYVHDSELLPEGSEHIEGIVARTDPYLFDGRGRRVMFKYKVRDL